MPVTISGDTGVSAVQNGAVDLTTDVTGTLPAANGGVGTASIAPANLSTGAPSWTSGGVLSFNSGYGSVATAYGCRAWVNFSGTTIRASGNVSSIVQRSTGDYTVNFTNAMVDKNYAVMGMVSDDALANRGFNIQNTYTVGMNTGYCYVTVFSPSTPTVVTVAFIR